MGDRHEFLRRQKESWMETEEVDLLTAIERSDMGRNYTTQVKHALNYRIKQVTGENTENGRRETGTGRWSSIITLQ
jgi:hypothetical protein